MASGEMPGITAKAVTSAPVSKKQDDTTTMPASAKHMVAGRRKLDEYRKKKEQRAGNKNKAAEKSVSTDVHAEALANGPNSGPKIEGNGRQFPVVAVSSNIGVNGGDAQPACESSSQDLCSEQGSYGESHDTTSIRKDFAHGVPSFSGYIPASVASVPSQPECNPVVKLLEDASESRLLTSKLSSEGIPDLKGGGHEQMVCTKATKEAENSTSLKVLKNNFLEHASGDNFKESTGVVSDGPFTSRIVKKPTETLHRHLSHESFPMLKEDPDSDTSVLGLASSVKDGRVGSKGDESSLQYRSSGISNGRRSWDPKEPWFSSSSAQPKKLPFSNLAEREPLFSSKHPDKLPFQLSSTTQTASPAVPALIDHQGGPSLLSASDQSVGGTLSDNERDSRTVRQQERKQKNDDFVALEQHIDDLTQEKFALQRALEAARSLAESLSQQNSSLTEDFNSQGAIINQLQEDLEKKKEEVTAQSLVLKSLMMERERAQQENNSAVERSQILAGEVIGLEEKVLRLRSSELKLQKELETLKVEKDSFRAQSTTLEKDRESLRAMVEVLQEDKKLLHGQLQKASTGGDSHMTSSTKGLGRDSRDASTCTDDLGLQVQNTQTSVSVDQTRSDVGEAASSLMPVLVTDSVTNSIGAGVPATFATLSADDFRAIDSIDGLITELFAEKKALLESLRRESARAMEFEALNSELSRKLETQTQRLELVVAQNMAYGSNAVPANSLELEPQYNDYADEGDEVVERVLGWIMRIFPGGSSRRQSSKRL